MTEPVMREILTKAVCGRGQMVQQNVVTHEITSPHEIQILGNYVTNSQITKARPLELSGNKKMVKVEGHYDLHVWYAFGQDTHSIKKTINYIETIPLNTYAGEGYTDSQATAEISSRPKCKKAYVKNSVTGKALVFEIEQGLTAEVIGITKLYVKALPSGPKSQNIVKGRELIPPTKHDTIISESYPSEDFYEDDEIK